MKIKRIIFLPFSLLFTLSFVQAQGKIHPCIAVVDSVFDGYITKKDLLINRKIGILSNLTGYQIIEFTLYKPGFISKIRQIKSDSDTFSKQIVQFLADSLKRGTIFFRNIKVRAPDNSIIKINPIQLRLNPEARNDKIQFINIQPTLGNEWDGKISKEKLLMDTVLKVPEGIDLKIIEFIFTIPNLKGFCLEFKKGGNCIGGREAIEIKKMKKGDFVHIYNIIAQNSKGIRFKLPVIILEIE